MDMHRTATRALPSGAQQCNVLDRQEGLLFVGGGRAKEGNRLCGGHTTAALCAVYNCPTYSWNQISLESLAPNLNVLVPLSLRYLLSPSPRVSM